MEPIKLVTTNKNKIYLINQIFDKNKCKIRAEMLDYDYPLLKRTDDLKEMVRYATKHSARKFSKKCLILELGVFIEALNGFPGINTNYVLKRIGSAGIIKLLQDQLNRKIELHSVLGYCAPGKDTKLFSSVINGHVAPANLGNNELGFESIFIPEGYDLTLGQDLELRNKLLEENYLDFAKYYIK